MKCTSLGQAKRVALIGAAKMAGEGYVFIRSEMNPSVGKIVRPAAKGGGVYRVQVANGRTGMQANCPCAFFRENCEFGTCKHVAHAQAEIEALDYCAAHGLEVGAWGGIEATFTN